jgi:UDP-N-acetylmuramate--alanine ligase
MKCSCEEVREKDLENGVHLSGIGGVGMSALAEMLLDLGVEVSGSDVTLSKNIDRLKKRGVKIYSTH